MLLQERGTVIVLSQESVETPVVKDMLHYYMSGHSYQ